MPGAGLAILLALPASTAFAQSPPASGRFVVAAGVLFDGSNAVGTTDATETAPNGSRFQLFATKSTLAPLAGVEGSVGVRLTRSIDAEISTTYGSAELQTRVSADAEGAAATTVAETLKQLTLEGSVVLHMARWRLGERAVPYLTAGGGYLRHLHEGQTLAETGRVYHVGAGLNYLLRRSASGGSGGVGVRIDARALIRSGGAAFDDTARAAPAFSALLFARF